MIEAIVLRCFYHNNTPIYKYRQTNQNKILSMHCQFRYFRHKIAVCKKLTNGYSAWLRRLDLNQRPSGYEVRNFTLMYFYGLQ